VQSSLNKKNNAAWRYQAVYVERDNGDNKKTKEFSICEIYLDTNGHLETWTESHKMTPYGESLDELLSDLEMMMEDVRNWKPVQFDALEVGMGFERTTLAEEHSNV